MTRAYQGPEPKFHLNITTKNSKVKQKNINLQDNLPKNNFHNKKNAALTERHFFLI